MDKLQFLVLITNKISRFSSTTQVSQYQKGETNLMQLQMNW